MDESASEDSLLTLNLGGLLYSLWRGWRMIAVVIGTLCLAITIYLHVATSFYTATAVVTPAHQEATSTSPLSKLQGAASALGITMPTALGVTDYERFKVTLTSVRLAEALDRKYGLVKTIYVKQWDAQHKVWLPPPGLVPFCMRVVKGMLGMSPTWAPPDARSLAAYLTLTVDQNEDPLNPVLTISYDSANPAFAKKMVTMLVKEGDEILRQIDGARTAQRLVYLRAELAGTQVADVRAALIQLISSQEQEMMTIRADPSYAIEVIQPPTVSQMPTSPNGLVYVLLAVVLGLFFGILLVFVFNIQIERILKRGGRNRTLAWLLGRSSDFSMRRWTISRLRNKKQARQPT